MVLRKQPLDPLIFPGEIYQIVCHYNLPNAITHEEILKLREIQITVIMNKFTLMIESIAKVKGFKGYILKGVIFGDRVEGDALSVIANYDFYSKNGFITTQKAP